MNRNYDELIKGIENRINPDAYTQRTVMFSADAPPSALFESQKVLESKGAMYIKKAMMAVNQTYTMNSKVAAEKVKAHLLKKHKSTVDYEYQGSVMTNTHIIKDHDIDLVQLTSLSKGMDHVGLDKALSSPSLLKPEEHTNLKKHKDNFSRYEGSQISDLRKVRLNAEEVLTSEYKTVDVSGAKSIAVKVTNPERDVDVVTAAYYKGVDYMKSNKKYRRGIQIYNKDSDSVMPVDYPFWSIKRINEQDIYVNGRLKNMIRFLKNLKFDSPDIDNDTCLIKSFHINAICYDIDKESYRFSHYLDLASILHKQLYRILNDAGYMQNLRSVDGTEKVFEKDTDKKLREVRVLYNLIDAVLADIHIQRLLIG
ncbi:hypothetical protein ACLI08_05205 [Flavobacterium sp. RNTU_13]|uniref:hypothetical protein n=1 Tax=Flavobacterium sp. RNTU_13 TaxID=3375145 RepID=UPI0039858EF3